MDSVITDVVSETATKVTLDKKFFLGAAAGILVVGAVVGGKKVVDRFKQRSAEKALNELDTDAE